MLVEALSDEGPLKLQKHCLPDLLPEAGQLCAGVQKPAMAPALSFGCQISSCYAWCSLPQALTLVVDLQVQGSTV